VDENLRRTAVEVLESLPLSIEMPAGTGKTQVVAAIAAVAQERGSRTLVLTHTHAGVDAIRRRLKQFDVGAGAVHIDTITGWAFDLVRSYPDIAGIRVPDDPDWSKSAEYVEGAVKVAESSAIQDMHRVSFDYFVVDEYQDCNEGQHELIVAIADAIPAACVLGDRLQGIFGFRGQVLVDWDVHVLPRFPAHIRDHHPWRWDGHNEDLGAWLLSIRPTLMAGSPLDLSSVSITGLNWKASDPTRLATSAFQRHPEGESVLVLGQWAGDANEVARNLNGMYGVMEDLQGRFMVDFLTAIDASTPSSYASLLAAFAKDCFSGLGRIDRAIQIKLDQGQPVGHLNRPGLEPVLSALDTLLAEPSLSSLLSAMSMVAATPSLQLFKREAWNDSRKAIETSSENPEVSCVAALSRIRDALRHTGRTPSKRVVSRTVLVKGLEYDHVIIANADILTSYRNLYVALSRARKTLTIFSASPRIRF
jgi:hypothetical protein